MLPSFTLFGLTLYPYSLCMIAGAALCFVLLFVRTLRRYPDALDENLFAVSAFVVSAAVALPAAMVTDALFKVVERGEFRLDSATFYGGLLCALLLYPVALSLRKDRKVSVYARLCDLAACIPAGHCLGRVGCFLGGCCFGKPTDGPFGIIFPPGSLPYEFYGEAIAIHPTQLYEAAFLLALFFLLLFAGKGAEFPLYLALYGAGRFIIEFFRNDDRGALFGWASPAQVISCVLFAVGAAIFVWRIAWRRRAASSRESAGREN